MSLLALLGIQDAIADSAVVPAVSSAAPAAAGTAATSAPNQGGIMSMVWMFAVFIIIFYFLLVRPQSKRAKEQRKLMDSLAKGDEVVMAGGLVGKIAKLNDDFVVITIASGVDVTFQKSAIAASLPKGTLKNIP